MNIVDIPNGAHGAYRDEVDGVVLHAIGEWVVDATNAAGGGKGRVYHCTDWLRAIGRSTHVFALPDGRGVREVDSNYRAWHAKGRNSHSCGIEFVLEGLWPYGRFLEVMQGAREAKYTADQLYFGVEWVRARAAEHGFEPNVETIWRHSDVSPGRKFDPGTAFPYDNFLNYCDGSIVDELGGGFG